MAEPKPQPVIPKIVIPESKLGGEYTDSSKIPIGYHKATITNVAVVTPEDQFSQFNNYQYRLVLSFPQFAEEGKAPPGLFFNITVLTPEKDKDGEEIEGAYRCAIYPGGTSKAVKVCEAAGIAVVPGLEITPDLFMNKEVAVSVGPHTNKKGEKVKIAKDILELSEIEEVAPPKKVAPPVAKTTPKKVVATTPNKLSPEDAYNVLLVSKFQNNVAKLEAAIEAKETKFNGLIPREGIIVMLQNE